MITSINRNYKDLVVETVCPFCGIEHDIAVNSGDFYSWYDGDELIQNAMPYLSANEREMLKTGICPRCWSNMFGEDYE